MVISKFSYITTNPFSRFFLNLRGSPSSSSAGRLIITADHGNCEQMIDYKTGEPHTAHTTNPVPVILVGMENAKLKEGKLADLAPTMLDIMNLPKPEEMTGESIIVEK